VPALQALSRCHAGLGDRQQALECSYTANARSALPVVVNPALTAALRAAAAETHTPLARPRATFDRIYLSDAERYQRLFSDDCHPTAEGQRLIAEAFLSRLREQGWPEP
jgi:hypothetical protein